MSIVQVGLAIAAGMAMAGVFNRPVTPVPSIAPSERATRADLVSIARDVEREIRLPGFADFAVGVAQNESRFNNLAIDDSTSAKREAARGLDNNPGRYGGTAWPRSWFTYGTGGWYQMLPTTALASSEWNTANPKLVFAPVASTVLLASFVQRVMRNHFRNLPASERNWLAMRRFLKSNRAGFDYLEQDPGTQGKRIRFGRDLAQNNIDPDFMYLPIPTGSVRATPDVYRRVLARRNIPGEPLG